MSQRTHRAYVLVFTGLIACVAAACSSPDPTAIKTDAFEAGNRYLADGKYREAVIEYRKAVQADPSFGDAHAKAGEAHEALNDPANALTSYLRAADLAPTNDELQIKAGNLLLTLGRFQDAEARARGVLRRNSSSAAAHLLLASALAGVRNFEAAFDAQQDALALDPHAAGAYVKMGALQYARGKRDEALTALQHAAQLEGRSASIQLSLGAFYWAIGQRREAEQAITRALELEPDNLLANGALASVYVGTARRAQAEPLLQRVVALAKDASSRVALSTYYLGERRHADAEKALEPLLADPGTFPIAKTRLAAIAFDAGRHDAALAHLDEVLKKEPQYVPALAYRTHFLLERGQDAPALESAKAAAEANPESALAQYALGRAYFANQDLEKARDAFAGAARLDPRATQAHLQLSGVHLLQGNVDGAVRSAEYAAAATRSLDSRLVLARALMSDPRMKVRAKAELQAILTEVPDSSTAHLMLGTLLAEERNREGARRAFQRALEIDPASLAAVNGLVGLDLAGGPAGAARTRLESFLRDNPESAAGWMLLAQVHEMEHNRAKAEEALRRVIAVNPAHLDAYAALGSLYLAANKLHEGRAEFIRVAEKQPRAVEVATLVGFLSELLGEPAEAERWYKKALQIQQNAPVAANNLAWMYAEQGQNLDVAVQLAQEASNQLPNRPEVADTLGWASYKADLITTAIPLFQKSIERNPSNPTYHYHLGLAYLKQRDMNRAKASLQRALSLNPSFNKAKEAREALESIY